MAPKIGARRNGKFKAVSTSPSFNKTPIGAGTPPVPYPVFQDLSTSIGTVTTVNFNSDPAYVLGQSSQPTCIGDAPGVALGVKSGTVSGEVKPVLGSSTVNVGRKPIIREHDPCTLNGGNCPGIYVTQPEPTGSIEAGEPVCIQPTPEPETPAETAAARESKGFWGDLWANTKYEVGEAIAHPWEGVKGAAKGVANIPSSLLEMTAKGSALNSAADLESAGAMQALFGQEDASATAFEAAKGMRDGVGDISVPKFEMSNSAQKGGDTIATAVQLLAAGAGLMRAGLKGLANIGKAEGALIRTETGASTRVIEGASTAAPGTDGLRVVGSSPKLRPRFSIGPQGQLKSTFARIEPRHLGTGTSTTESTRDLAMRLGNATDDAGHAIGKNLGGSGAVNSGNIFPQAPSVNRGAFAQFEKQVAKQVEAGREVYVRVVPRYAPGATRPSEILYQVRIDGVTTSRVFPNP